MIVQHCGCDFFGRRVVLAIYVGPDKEHFLLKPWLPVSISEYRQDMMRKYTSAVLETFATLGPSPGWRDLTFIASIIVVGKSVMPIAIRFQRCNHFWPIRILPIE